MSKSFGAGSESLADYAEVTFQPEDEVLRDIRARAEAANMPPIHVGAMDGLHLHTLARAMNARKIVEIGTLAGYSGVCLARALPDDGRLYTFEFSQKHAEVAQESFRRAGVAAQVELFVGSALERLTEIESLGPFDLVFIDADKVNYPQYFKWAARNLRVGGSFLADNTFADGLVAAGSRQSARAETMRSFNSMAAEHRAFVTTILPTGEGLTFGVKISDVDH